jgi:hypothetical protein
MPIKRHPSILHLFLSILSPSSNFLRTTLLAGYCSVAFIFMVGTAGAQPERVHEFTGGDQVANPPPQPLRVPGNLRFVVTQPAQVETQFELQWDGASHATGYRVFRRLEPVVAIAGRSQPPPADTTLTSLHSLGSDQTSPQGWQEIGQLVDDGSGQFHFIDTNISPLDASQPASVIRHLGVAHCYKIQAYREDETRESSEICERIRGINAPTDLRAEATSPTSFRVYWNDHSNFETGFKVYFRRSHQTRYIRTVAWYNGRLDNIGSSEITDLLEDASDYEHCVAVTSYDYYGESARRNEICGIMLPKPEPDQTPEEYSFSVNLQRQDVHSGPIPYLGSFPTNGGPLPVGNLTSVRSSHVNPTLYFVKPGHSTSECEDSDAVITLEANNEISPDEMETLYGSPTPELPITFLACAGVAANLPNWISINITYRKDD